MSLASLSISATAVALLVASTAVAQPYPAKPIRMIVASSSGTSSDFFARMIGQVLTDKNKMQVVVDNRTGAGGLIGNALVSKGAPDGYTLGMVGLTRVLSALLRKEPPYHPLEDTTAIMQVASLPNVLVTSPHVQANSVREFVALVKSKPGQFNFASPGLGSSSHLAAEIFNRAAGLQAVHVPFKIVTDSFTETMGGQVHYFVYTLPSTLPMLQAGKLRPLAVTTSKRSPVLPSIPTFEEAGLPAAQFDNWSGIVGPRGMSAKLVAQLHADIAEILSRPETKEKFVRQGAESTSDSNPGAFTDLLRSEHERYRNLLPAIGIQQQ